MPNSIRRLLAVRSLRPISSIFSITVWMARSNSGAVSVYRKVNPLLRVRGRSLANLAQDPPRTDLLDRFIVLGDI